MNIFDPQPWVERLGLTLLHFLWQGFIVAAIYAAARKWRGRNNGPNGRYLLACAALAAMAIMPLITWMLLRPPTPESVVPTFAAPLSARRIEPALISLPGGPEQTAPYAISLVGGCPLVHRRYRFPRCACLRGWMLAERFRSRMVRPASSAWQRTLDRLKTQVSVSRPVRLLVSGALHVPANIGCLRPIVLVPVGALTGLPAAQIEALLIHELAHIRRHDYLLNILQSAIEAVFFYHPAVWWISGHMRAERELCCDDIAVSLTGDPVVYARALAEFDSQDWIQTVVMAANGGSLASRIARLLGHPSVSRRSSSGPGTALALTLLSIGAWTGFAQSSARPQFEVASVKPSLSQTIQNVRPLPGRLTADATLQVLIQYAYGLQPFQVVGAPDLGRYQIDAKADGNASRDRMFLMLQSLLEDRFKLKTHRDAKELPVYALVPNKGTVKLPPPQEGSCVDSAADAATECVGGGRMMPPGQAPPTKGRCGSAIVSLTPAGPQLKGGKIAMPELVRALSQLLGRSVINQTGFTGVFDLELTFAADDTTPSLQPPPPGSPPEFPRSGRINCCQALQQQLGLRLQSTKGPVPVIVVDHAEAPSGN